MILSEIIWDFAFIYVTFRHPEDPSQAIKEEVMFILYCIIEIS